MRVEPLLIVFGGLPGTGKTTLARALGKRRPVVYVRIDAIEQALRDAARGESEVGATGYVVARALARSNLQLGATVVADSVNPLPVTRAAWREVASSAGAALLEVEVVCADVAEHRRRVENRGANADADLPRVILPTWAEVRARDYAPWPEPHMVIDTSQASVDGAVALLEAAIARATPHRPRPEYPRFHLAFPVTDLAEARRFYGDFLGCAEGRASDDWVDFDFHGHQIVAHRAPAAALAMAEPKNLVDGHEVPVRHFGVILELAEWRELAARLHAAGVDFIVPPGVRFEGLPGEQATMFFLDPFGNALEFKAFRDIDLLFAKSPPA